MYKIGDFSILSKTTIKTLRYYEKEKLLIPFFIDPENNYRYYQRNQLDEISRIISLRQVGLSIKDIKKVLNGSDIKKILENRKKEIENSLILYKEELTKINNLMKESVMETEITVKELPGCTVYYKEGVIKDYSEMTNFILDSADECLKLNPNMKCTKSDYCYVNYLDGEYKEKDINIRYAQAVEEPGVENNSIKFMRLDPVKCVSIYHKGPFESIRQSYGKVMKYIDENGYEILEYPRECYIHGVWDCESESDWLTEIQVPIKKI